MKLILLILLVNTHVASAASNFNKICSRAMINDSALKEELSSQIFWLTKIFHSEDCDKIESQIRDLKSFSSLLPIQFKHSKKFHSPPDDLIPVELIIPNQEFFHKSELEWEKMKANFKSLSLFREFSNLTHIYVDSKEDRDICSIISDIPSIKVLTLETLNLNQEEIDCLLIKPLKLYIAGSFKGINRNSKVIDSIVGIDDYQGELFELQYYRNLKYLGLEEYKPTSRLNDLVLIRNLSNLKINIKNLSFVEELSSLKNLRTLTLNCYDREPGTYNPEIEGGDKCNFPVLISIEFIAKLNFLVGLDLGWNAIKDLTPISKLQDLKYLNVRKNQIHSLPDFNKMPKLKVVILDENKISTLAKIKNDKIKFSFAKNPISKNSDSCPKNSSNVSIKKFCNSN